MPNQKDNNTPRETGEYISPGRVVEERRAISELCYSEDDYREAAGRRLAELFVGTEVMLLPRDLQHLNATDGDGSIATLDAHRPGSS